MLFLYICETVFPVVYGGVTQCTALIDRVYESLCMSFPTIKPDVYIKFTDNNKLTNTAFCCLVSCIVWNGK